MYPAEIERNEGVPIGFLSQFPYWLRATCCCHSYWLAIFCHKTQCIFGIQKYVFSSWRFPLVTLSFLRLPPYLSRWTERTSPPMGLTSCTQPVGTWILRCFPSGGTKTSARGRWIPTNPKATIELLGPCWQGEVGICHTSIHSKKFTLRPIGIREKNHHLRFILGCPWYLVGGLEPLYK